MKLRSCHIDNFGKLSDLHLEFQDGVNLFHEPNAWGKSTLAAFLRVMFYGFDSKRESGLFDKERVVPRSEVKFSDWTVRRLKGAHLLHKMTANAARLMRSMPSWEIL